jgi:hypothetical protein
MTMRIFAAAAVLVTLTACLGLTTGAHGQRPEPQVLKDFKQNPHSPEVRTRYLQTVSDVAKSSYDKLKKARDGMPDSLRTARFDYEIRRASLEWFKSQIAATTTPEEGVRIAAEYLDRDSHDRP